MNYRTHYSKPKWHMQKLRLVEHQLYHPGWICLPDYSEG